LASGEFEQAVIDKAASIIMTAEMVTGFIGYSSSMFAGQCPTFVG